MAEVGRRLGLAPEALHERVVGAVLGVEHLHGHLAAQQRVVGLVDVGHPPPGDVGGELVAVGEGAEFLHETCRL